MTSVGFLHVCSEGWFWRSLPAHHAGQLQFFDKHASLTKARAFAAYLAPCAAANGGLQQTPIRRTQRSVAVPRSLYPSCRHLQPPPRRTRRQRRHLQVEGLPHRRTPTIQGDDTRYPRVAARPIVPIDGDGGCWRPIFPCSVSKSSSR